MSHRPRAQSPHGTFGSSVPTRGVASQGYVSFCLLPLAQAIHRSCYPASALAAIFCLSLSTLCQGATGPRLCAQVLEPPFPQPRRQLRAQAPGRAVRLCGPTVAGCSFKARAMTPVGFEPSQFALVEIGPTPLDHSGKASTAGMTKIVVTTSGTVFP